MSRFQTCVEASYKELRKCLTIFQIWKVLIAICAVNDGVFFCVRNDVYGIITLSISRFFRQKLSCGASIFDAFPPPLTPSLRSDQRSTNQRRNSNTREGKTTIIPKTEDLDYELSPYTTFSGDVGAHYFHVLKLCLFIAYKIRGILDNVASSSGGNLRAFFIGMGFLPYLVDKVIEENGDDNSEILLEALLRCSKTQLKYLTRQSWVVVWKQSPQTPHWWKAGSLAAEPSFAKFSNLLVEQMPILVLQQSRAHKSNSDSSDSLDGSLNTSRGRSAPNFCPDGHSKELVSTVGLNLIENEIVVNVKALQKSNSQSSDSLDSLFDDTDPHGISTVNQTKEILSHLTVNI
ncbi:hypothetical protein VNO77_05567 [Canavalia gladiata]|uniref:Uncharacterized protein n=1 Tax=Canavalia gladiata TaxID=3824 RepID=A0AAN9RA55_CANGL